MNDDDYNEAEVEGQENEDNQNFTEDVDPNYLNQAQSMSSQQMIDNQNFTEDVDPNDLNQAQSMNSQQMININYGCSQDLNDGDYQEQVQMFINNNYDYDYNEYTYEVEKDIQTEPGFIIVKNQSKMKIFARINDKSGLPIDYMEIPIGKEEKWSRKKKVSFILQYAFNKYAKNGPSFVVNAGNFYTIDKSFNLITQDGLPATPSFDNFEDETSVDYGDDDDNYDQYYNEDDQNEDNKQEDPKAKQAITIINQTDKVIRVRMLADSDGGNIGIFPIQARDHETWERKKGKYLTEIITVDNKTSKYSILTNEVVVFNEQKNLVYKKTGEKVESSSDPFDISQPDVNPKDQLKNTVRVINHLDHTIFIRVQSKQVTGSEDKFAIDSKKEYEWKRNPGEKLLLEITDNNTVSNYYVESNHTYNVIIGDVLDQETNLNVPNCEENFEDHIQQPQILVDTNNNNNNINDNQNNAQVPETCSYFNDIKPNYIKGTKFTDQHFPPHNNSILAVNDKGCVNTAHLSHSERSEKNIIPTEGKEFKRISDVFNGKTFYLFKDNVDVRDISQGQLGDCWYMSSIAALATRPELIQKIFRTSSINPDGYYELFYYEAGEKKLMYLDDYVVCQDGEIHFAKPNGEEIWVILLEKLMAKFEGGYNNLQGGYCHEALPFLTGGICQTLDNLKSRWNEICSAINRGNIVTCGTFSKEGKTDQNERDGIHYGHAYSILDAKEFTGNGVNFRLVKLRNPWGQGEWKGKWNDDDPSWTPQYKQYFNFKEGSADDGIFYMEFSDFCNYYEDVDICNI